MSQTTNGEPPTQPGQLSLFTGEIEQRIEEGEKEGRYTLERVKERRRPAYEAAIAMLGCARPGYEGLARIGRTLGLHHLTVAAIRDDPDARVSIDMVRSKLAGQFRVAAELLVERILENPGIIPPQSIGMVIDQLTRNAELLDGRATSRTEHAERIDIFADWEKVLQQLPDEKELPAENVLEIGSLPGKKHPLEATAASPDAPAAPPVTDVKSFVQAPTHEGDTAIPTDSATDSPRPEGAGGVPDHEGAAHDASGSSSRKILPI